MLIHIILHIPYHVYNLKEANASQLAFYQQQKVGEANPSSVHMDYGYLPLFTLFCGMSYVLFTRGQRDVYVICLFFRTLTKFSKGSMRILVLHKNKEHIEECAAVLNEEWPRSKTARCSIYLKTENNYL